MDTIKAELRMSETMMVCTRCGERVPVGSRYVGMQLTHLAHGCMGAMRVCDYVERSEGKVSRG